MRRRCCCLVAQSCPTLCDPMDCSMPGFPVLHHLPELAQTHVHWVSDAIQPFHILLAPSLPALNLFQHQGLFQWVSFSHQVAKMLKLQLQHQSFQWILRTDILWDWLVGSPFSPKDSQESSPIPQFKSIDSSELSSLYDPALTFIWMSPAMERRGIKNHNHLVPDLPPVGNTEHLLECPR